MLCRKYTCSHFIENTLVHFYEYNKYVLIYYIYTYITINTYIYNIGTYIPPSVSEDPSEVLFGTNFGTFVFVRENNIHQNVSSASLDFSGSFHCPRVHIPHLVAIPNPLLTVSVSAWVFKVLSQLERNCSSVSSREYWQLTNDTFDWQEIKDWFLGVELVKDQRPDRFQPF